MEHSRITQSCLLALSLMATACGPATEEMPIPAPSASTAASVPLDMTTAPASTPPTDAQTTKLDPSILSTTDPAGYTKKDLENIIQHLDWHAENYISQMNKIPTMDELKSWRDPNFRLGLPEWPKPPAGKKWAMNEKSGQFSLVDEAPTK